MAKHIAIIGAGYAGLNLALLLQQKNVQVTLFSNKTAEEIENGPVLNTVARHNNTLEREAQLGVNFWDVPFTGMMDDLRFYDDVLTADDVGIVAAQNAAP